MATTGCFLNKKSKYPAPILKNREDLMWLAGYLEGEGCFWAGHKGNMIVTVSTVDEDIAKRAHCLMGGCLSQVRATVTGKKVYRVDVLARRYAYALMVALYKFMGVRRQAKIIECLKYYSGLKGAFSG